MVDIELLEATMRHIEANPQAHDQGAWFYQEECGATYCFAGHAALLAGAEPPDPDSESPWLVSASLLPTPVPRRYRGRVDRNGNMFVQHFAAFALGLTPQQHSYLFHSADDAEQLRRLVDVIKADPDVDGNTLYEVLYGPDEEDEED